MLTKKEFDELPDGAIFRTGEIIDSPEGINMSGSGKMLRFIAKKRYTDDWCVYVHWATNDWSFIQSNGDKVHDKENIRRAVPHEEVLMSQYAF